MTLNSHEAFQLVAGITRQRAAHLVATGATEAIGPAAMNDLVHRVTTDMIWALFLEDAFTLNTVH